MVRLSNAFHLLRISHTSPEVTFCSVPSLGIQLACSRSFFTLSPSTTFLFLPLCGQDYRCRQGWSKCLEGRYITEPPLMQSHPCNLHDSGVRRRLPSLTADQPLRVFLALCESCILSGYYATLRAKGFRHTLTLLPPDRTSWTRQKQFWPVVSWCL